ncbi:uncharacterized protein LOC143184690 [Calliopsis andreniformis]|uniref:uncharacterized protein LOC143184690 n=1 Tax=Calliopsis andreniformis TaxID=337506 RepID=UPI003FCE791D
MDQVNNKMLTLATFQLTHPEALSETELREILENSCIDSSTYKNLSRLELIDLYKRIAMPLPQRQDEHIQDSDTKKCDEKQCSVKESQKNSISLNRNIVERNKSETEISQSSHMRRLKSPVSDLKQTNKRIHLFNSNNLKQSNGINKRLNNEKHIDSPSKKRQKITWP